MKIPIKYNDISDEFITDEMLEKRLENYIRNHFSIAYIISKQCPIYLIGGSIRDLMYAKKPKDLDFVVLGEENIDFIMQIFEMYNIQYQINKLGGFKFEYDSIIIDLWLTNNLFSSIQYNVDGLLFDLSDNSLVSLTFHDFVNNGLKLVNSDNNINNGREKKLLEFEKNIEMTVNK